MTSSGVLNEKRSGRRGTNCEEAPIGVDHSRMPAEPPLAVRQQDDDAAWRGR